jgi:uncharacterized protein
MDHQINITMKYVFFLGVLLIVSLRSSCQERLTGRDVRLYQGTPVWDAALAIRDNDYARLRKEISGKPSSFIDFKEKRFGQSLLNWSVYRDDLEATKILAEHGANPNLKDNDSTSAFINAAAKLQSSEYLKVLLKHGGNVNAIADVDKPEDLRTPLIAAAQARLESVQMLVNAGAKVNYIHRSRRGNIGGENIQSALIYACMLSRIDIVEYLIFEIKADFNYVFSTSMHGEPHSILFYLRRMTFPIDSQEHQVKMKVVEFLKTQGLDYSKEPIPAQYQRNYDKQYLERY